MQYKRYAGVVLLLLVCAIPLVAKSTAPRPWRAVHLLDYNTDAELDALGRNLEALAKQGSGSFPHLGESCKVRIREPSF